jgi:hypothetical protein
MIERRDRLTLEDLLSDPLTRLVMRADKVTVDETARAFAAARRGLERQGVRPAHLSGVHPAAGQWRRGAQGPYRLV